MSYFKYLHIIHEMCRILKRRDVRRLAKLLTQKSSLVAHSKDNKIKEKKRIWQAKGSDVSKVVVKHEVVSPTKTSLELPVALRQPKESLVSLNKTAKRKSRRKKKQKKQQNEIVAMSQEEKELETIKHQSASQVSSSSSYLRSEKQALLPLAEFDDIAKCILDFNSKINKSPDGRDYVEKMYTLLKNIKNPVKKDSRMILLAMQEIKKYPKYFSESCRVITSYKDLPCHVAMLSSYNHPVNNGLFFPISRSKLKKLNLRYKNSDTLVTNYSKCTCNYQPSNDDIEAQHENEISIPLFHHTRHPSIHDISWKISELNGYVCSGSMKIFLSLAKTHERHVWCDFNFTAMYKNFTT